MPSWSEDKNPKQKPSSPPGELEVSRAKAAVTREIGNLALVDEAKVPDARSKNLKDASKAITWE